MWHSVRTNVILSITNKTVTLSFTILSAERIDILSEVHHDTAKRHPALQRSVLSDAKLSVTNKTITLSVITLNVVVLSVVAPSDVKLIVLTSVTDYRNPILSAGGAKVQDE